MLYGLDHDPACGCAICKRVRFETVVTIQADRDHLADAWAKWISTDDGEVDALLAGRDGAPGSPRWVALQAIAMSRQWGAG